MEAAVFPTASCEILEDGAMDPSILNSVGKE